MSSVERESAVLQIMASVLIIIAIIIRLLHSSE